MTVPAFWCSSFLPSVEIDQPPARSLWAAITTADQPFHNTTSYILQADLHSSLVRLGVVGKPTSIRQSLRHLQGAIRTDAHDRTERRTSDWNGYILPSVLPRGRPARRELLISGCESNFQFHVIWGRMNCNDKHYIPGRSLKKMTVMQP